MQYLTQPLRAHPPEFNEPGFVRSGSAFSFEAKAKTEPKFLGQFQLVQTMIPLEGGQHCLRLRKPLTLKVNRDLRCEVQDWGIEVNYSEVPHVPREVARRFLFLLNAAENEQLKEKDQADLVRISEYIDFRQFTIDRSPPRYQEGILRSNKENVIVEWHDGTRESLRRNAGRALDEVDIGERFAAYVKLGKDDQTVAIERVSLLRPVSNLSGEDCPAWPTKSS
jgi:hypothetical protein